MNWLKWFFNSFETLVRIKVLEAKVVELEATLLEYHEIIETGWDYPLVTQELPSPRGLIPKATVKYSKSERKLTIQNCPETILAVIADTNSMEPMIDDQHTPFLIPMPQPEAPFRYEDLRVGDIAIYQAGAKLIFHTIVKIITDFDGRLYTFRGNNTGREDPWLVRDNNIKYLYYGGVNTKGGL